MIKTYSLLSTVFFTMLFSVSILGQQDVNFALYKYHMNIINPAFTGSQEGTFVNSSFRSQWAGVADAPRIQAVSLGVPSVEKRLNYGALFYNDKTFVEQLSRFYANFSYRLRLQSEMDLYLGLGFGGQNFALNFDSLQNVNPIGDQFLSSYSRFTPNVGVGAYLKAKNFYVSLSAPKLFQTKRFNEKSGFINTARDLVHIYGSIGRNVPLSTDWIWVNSVLVRYVDNAPWSFVTNTGLSFKNNEFTLGYQWDSSLAATLMVKDIGFISVGYSYQFPSRSALAALTKGSHELLIKIRLGKSADTIEIEEGSEEETKNFENKI